MPPRDWTVMVARRLVDGGFFLRGGGMDEPTWLRAAEAARLIGVSSSRIRQIRLDPRTGVRSRREPDGSHVVCLEDLLVFDERMRAVRRGTRGPRL